MQCVFDEVGKRLFEFRNVHGDDSEVAVVSLDAPARLLGWSLKSRGHGLNDGFDRDCSLGDVQLGTVAARKYQEVVGQVFHPLGLCGGGLERHSQIVPWAWPSQREFQL